MSKPVRFDREAEDELDAALAWYESQRQGLGLELLEAVDDALKRIGEAPLQFPLRTSVPARFGVRTCSVQRFPYSMVFIDLPSELRILALAHARRRPDYWRSRL